ncbi:hypothetical protein BB779_04135 [Pseudomonas viridiflava]|uniref:competence protein CoiA n=1 Tax=Pseudomonas viridiflava TaxID=33069 RepID=UPI00083FD058|nr:competence protein CoiA family protein [Pseudomonas viridiflava]ODJ92267.1 hypothetical protein BB779_04135 [Pseudomonas viridiflava]
MRYANVNGVKSEAQPKMRGVCRACDEEVVAKCGKHVIWHWSHLSLSTCDRWCEAETEWHRQWKDRFPEDWQEVIQYDALTGEKHIADIRTEHGVFVEFQRSTIDPAEVNARESFYQRMVWVIDGSKSEFDSVNFSNMRSRPDANGFAFFRWYGRSKLFHRWHTTTPVFIDFGDKYGFWRVCKFDPKSKEGVALLVDRSLFTAALIQGTSDFSRNGGPASAF